jgi:DnaJ-class molecular chaperone
MIAYYYDILGLEPGADLASVKRSYRAMAKVYHPDLNSDDDASRHFILINEAYEYLSRSLEMSARASDHVVSSEEDMFYEEWIRTERQKARERAAEHARMKFERFKDSKMYKTTQILLSFGDVFSTVMGVVVLVGTFMGLSQDGLEGLPVAFFSVPFGLIMVFYPWYKRIPG